jgi:hypothetical protein
MLWCGDRVPGLHAKRDCIPQHDGIAVHSLASEHLQELEGLVGLEREMQEEVVGVTMGSMYHGEALLSLIKFMGLTRRLASRYRNCTCFLIFACVPH